MRTPTQRLADILLAEPVEDWIARQRVDGQSWRRISLQLRDDTKGEIDVTPTTLLTWLADDSARAAS